MHVVKLLLIGLSCTIFFNCDKSESDPATATRDDFNPPGQLFTVTQDSKIELRWTAQNVEDDFQGFYVFVTTKSLADIQALVKYPSTAVNISNSGIPRCSTNSAFFEAFGLGVSEADCEDSGTAAAASTMTDGSVLALDETEELTGWVKCDEADAKPSIAATTATTLQKCTVSKLTDGTTALLNGTTYGFMVVGVMGTDLDDLSWSSNVVFDTPSVTAFNENVTFKSQKYTPFTIDAAAGTVTKGTETDCAAVGTNDECSVYGLTNNATTSPTIFLARDTTTSSGNLSYAQRMWISVTSDTTNATIKLQPRGPQTHDPTANAPVIRAPGDMATDTYDATLGTHFAVYGNQVFDFQITSGTSVYYGKVIIRNWTVGATEAADVTADVTFVVQKTAGVRDYLR